MKQSFEVFEQSDGVALHLTVTVDSDAFARSECRTEVEAISHSGSNARKEVELGLAPHLKKLPDAVRAAIQQATNTRDDIRHHGLINSGKENRQPEVDLLNAQVTSLRNQLAELTEAQKATKKPRATRKATRK